MTEVNLRSGAHDPSVGWLLGDNSDRQQPLTRRLLPADLPASLLERTNVDSIQGAEGDSAPRREPNEKARERRQDKQLKQDN